MTFFLDCAGFIFSEGISFVATGRVGVSGAGLGCDLVIAIATSPIPSTNAPPMPSAIVAYRIVLSVLQAALTL